MAYDSARGEMVLITTKMETWTFDGISWTQKSPSTSPSPSPNGYFSMAFDPTRQVASFFSGESQSQSGSVYPDTTWEWNGSDWSEFTAGAATSTYASLDSALNMSLPAIDLEGACYQAILNYYVNTADPDNLYWVLDMSSLGSGSNCGSDAAVLNPANLQMTLPNIEVQGTFFQVVLDYYNNAADPAGLYWVLDLTSITQN